MSICAVVFTYPDDYAKAFRLLSNLKDKVDAIYFCIESKHKDFPLPDWVTPLVTDFNRCNTLKGTQAIIGIKSVYQQLAKEYDYVIKIDSDTILIQPEQVLKPIECGTDFIYIRRDGMVTPDNKIVRRANGCCYALSRKAIAALDLIDSNIFDSVVYANDRHEDLALSHLLTEYANINIHDIDKSKVWLSVRPYRQLDCIAAHFGYCDFDRIKSELKKINPLLLQTVFNEENESAVKKLEQYCESKGIMLKQYTNLYDENGQPYQAPASNYPPPKAANTPNAKPVIKLPESPDAS